jgi:hypothetical protein
VKMDTLEAIRLSPSRLLLITLLCIFSITIIVYTITAYSVARYVYENEDKVVWRYSPPGSFLPWPKEPGMLTALSKMNPIDLFIYQYFIKTWLLIVVTLSIWIAMGIYIAKYALTLRHTFQRRGHGPK